MSRATRWRVAASVVAVALAASACSQGSATRDNDSGGDTTITFSAFSATGGHENDLQKIADAFHTANPNITVKIDNVAYADYFTKLQTAVAGGTASDAFELNYENFVTYASDGALAQLDGVDTSTYRKSLVDAFAQDGKQYGLPESFSDVVLLYNKTLFDQAGVAYPTSSWTWADETAAAQKLTNKSAGVWGDYQPVTYNEFYKALAQAGGQFFNDDKTQATFDSDQGVKAASWLVDKVGTTMPTAADGAGTPDYDTNLFKSGKLAMLHTGIWTFSSFQDVPFDWDIAVEPGDTQKASAMFSNAAVVSSQSKKKDAAQKWVQYLTASDTTVQTRLSSAWELPPTSNDTQLQSYLTAGKPANRQAVFDALDSGVLPPVIKAQQEMQDAVTDALTGAVDNPGSVQGALASAQKTVTGLTG